MPRVRAVRHRRDRRERMTVAAKDEVSSVIDEVVQRIRGRSDSAKREACTQIWLHLWWTGTGAWDRWPTVARSLLQALPVALAALTFGPQADATAARDEL